MKLLSGLLKLIYDVIKTGVQKKMKTFMEGKLTAFRGIIMLMLMMCAVLVAKAQENAVAKQKPVISIGLNGKEGYGDKSKGE